MEDFDLLQTFPIPPIDKLVVTLHNFFKWVIFSDECWVIAVYIAYSQLFNYGVRMVLLAHNYHIIGSFVCRDENIMACNLWRMCLISGLCKTLHSGDLKCLSSLKCDLQLLLVLFWTNFFALRSKDSKNSVSVSFPVDPVLFASLYFGQLARINK